MEKLSVKSVSKINKKKDSKQQRKKGPNKCWAALKRYLANASIHGVPFLVEDGRHWTEIIFWLVACAASWYYCGVTVADTIINFLTRKTAITMDTNYLNWEVDAPAVHFCFAFSLSAKTYLTSVIEKPKQLNKVGMWNKFGYDSSIKQANELTSEQYAEFRNALVPRCHDIFGVCLWNNEPIDCCKIFFPIHTNLGVCLSYNSIHGEQPSDPNLPPFTMNHHKPMAKLTIFLNDTDWWRQSKGSLKVFVMDPKEYPTQNIGTEAVVESTWTQDKFVQVDVSQTPTYNDNGVITTDMYERGCRLSSEMDGIYYIKHYNYYGCIMEAQMTQFNKSCGCVGHIYPTSSKYPTCNHTQLKCSDGDQRRVITIATNNDCLPDCEETKVVLFKKNIPTTVPSWAATGMIVNMLPGPTIKYHRYTVISLLDVVVNVGGNLGLFVGMSVLSLVEVPYWFFIRRSDD